MSNERTYHLAAILRRKKMVVKVGANVNKTHPHFGRTYDDGSSAFHMHAEMNVLRFSRPGDTIEVMRFSHGEYTMARPCHLCMKHMRDAGIKRVRFTNWAGAWEELRL